MADFERINLRIDPEFKRAAMAKAKAEDLTLSQVIRRLLREWLGAEAPQVQDEAELLAEEVMDELATWPDPPN